MDYDRVTALLKETAAQDIMPLFRNLAEGQVWEKGRNDFVTEADHAAEQRLTQELTALLPGSVVVGEESVHDDPAIRERIFDPDPVWIIDPVDGTRNFKDGQDSFCIIVALARGGTTEAGWIYAPALEETAMAVDGEGTIVNGERVQLYQAPEREVCESSVNFNFLPKRLHPPITESLAGMGKNHQIYSSGITYLRLVTGAIQLALFWGTKPWDHAAGSLLVKEAGGLSQYIDGTPYRPDLPEHKGLLVTSDPALWTPCREAFFPDGAA